MANTLFSNLLDLIYSINFILSCTHITLQLTYIQALRFELRSYAGSYISRYKVRYIYIYLYSNSSTKI